MARLYITEYAAIGQTWSGAVNVGKEPRAADQVVAIGGSSQQSQPLQPGARRGFSPMSAG